MTWAYQPFRVFVTNMSRYPSFILQSSLDCYPIDARMKLHAKSFFFRLIRAFFRPAARLDTGSMYRSALSFNIKDKIPRSPLSGIFASLRPATSIQYLASLRVVHHHCELPTKPCSKRNGILTIAVISSCTAPRLSQRIRFNAEPALNHATCARLQVWLSCRVSFVPSA